MFKEVTLEVSLKPFYNTDDASVEQVVEKIYEQWKPLIKEREIIRIMLWIGDGSEILDYDGEESTSFDWAHYLGMANCPDVGDLPKHTSLHTHRQLYRENIPNMTYGILKNITFWEMLFHRRILRPLLPHRGRLRSRTADRRTKDSPQGSCEWDFSDSR